MDGGTQFSDPVGIYGGFLRGYFNSWMVYFMENPISKWMRTGGTVLLPIFSDTTNKTPIRGLVVYTAN